MHVCRPIPLDAAPQRSVESATLFTRVDAFISLASWDSQWRKPVRIDVPFPDVQVDFPEKRFRGGAGGAARIPLPRTPQYLTLIPNQGAK